MTDCDSGNGPEDHADAAYSINDLADRGGVTRRTVHYYISQGLLPASGTEGRGTRYGKPHLDRLRLIRELQREHLPLAEIRQRLVHLSDTQIADLLARGEVLAEPRGTAFDYIQAVLSGTSLRAFEQPAPSNASSPAAAQAARPAAAALVPQARALLSRAKGAGAAPPRQVAEAAAQYSQPSQPSTRSQWERISLAPDVELHVRRPSSRLQNRAIDRLVAFSRQLFEEDPS